MKLKYSIILFCLIGKSIWAQTGSDRMTVEQYIETYKMLAVQEMYRAKIPASITMAQALLESGCGNSELCKLSNNHFGIKCKTNWNGRKTFYDDDTLQECFRSYDSVHQSYKDHSDFLLSQPRYGFLFNLEPNDYKGWSYGLKKAGYATNPQYADKLIAYIEKHELYKLDYISSNEMISKNISDELNTNMRAEINVNETQGIIAKAGDTYQQIAVDYDMRMWQLKKYNDMPDSLVCHTGDTVYLKPKRNKSMVDSHKVKTGETLRSISQLYAIKLRKLYQRNLLEPGEEPMAGETIYLNRTQEVKPKVYLTKFTGSFDEPFDYNKLFKDDSAFAKRGDNKKPDSISTTGSVQKLSQTTKTPIAPNVKQTTHVDSAKKYQPQTKDSTIVISISDYREYQRLKYADSLSKHQKKIGEQGHQAQRQTVYKQSKKHEVKAGETLYKIAQLYEVTVDDIKAVNNLESNNISLGQIILIPTSVSAHAAADIKTTAYKWIKGDRFTKVAIRYHLNTQELLKINSNIDTTDLRVGDVIQVPINKKDDREER